MYTPFKKTRQFLRLSYFLLYQRKYFEMFVGLASALWFRIVIAT